MEYVEEVNDEKYVLLEFPNENGNVAVGYLAWLNRKEDDIQNIIKNRENVVTRCCYRTNSAKNCTIGPVTTKLKKKLQNCEWTVHVVYIIGFGGLCSIHICKQKI